MKQNNGRQEKRRRIKQWASEFEAREKHECTRCETAIPPYTYYLRNVFARGNRLEVEREHTTPNCPDHYVIATRS